MCWQPSRTYSWHVAGCYAVRDLGSSVPIEGKNSPTWARFSFKQGEIRPTSLRCDSKLFIQHKLRLRALFRGSLPRGSLGLQSKNVSGLFYLSQRTAKKASGSLGSSESRMEKRGMFPLHCSRRLIDVMSNNGLSKNILASTAVLSGV